MSSRQGVAYLDGRRLKRAVCAGARHIIAKRGDIDAINVFPVADRDTGTNMGATFRSIWEGLQDESSRSLEVVASKVADSALLGARGNSGAILAAFFCGLNEGVQNYSRITVTEWARAVELGYTRAREVLAHPVEGTIITVMRAWVQHFRQDFASQDAANSSRDFSILFSGSLATAKAALQRTEYELADLTEAHVVDAGALGFVYFLEGIDFLLQSGDLAAEQNRLAPPEPLAAELSEAWTQHDLPVAGGRDILLRYCTECLISTAAEVTAESGARELNPGQIRNLLMAMGDSVAVAGGRKKLRIHVHTDQPDRVYSELRKLGTLSQEKVDDMKQQGRDALLPPEERALALIADSGCDLPEEYLERHNIHLVPQRVYFGEETYLDKVTLPAAAFYQKLRTSPHYPRTSMPAPADFRRSYEMIIRNYSHALSVHVPQGLSGTYQTAKSQAAMVSSHIHPLDAKAASVGQGLLVLEAAKAISAGGTWESVTKLVEECRKRLKFVMCLNTMEYLVRGGRITKVQGAIGSILRLKPIICVNEDGRSVLEAKTIGGILAERKVLQIIKQFVAGMVNLRFGLAHADDSQLAERYRQRIAQTFPGASCLVTELSSALGVHAGPGAIAVAVLGDYAADALPSR